MERVISKDTTALTQSILLSIPDILLAELLSFLGIQTILVDIAVISHRFQKLLVGFPNLWTARFYFGRRQLASKYLTFPLSSICFGSFGPSKVKYLKHAN